MNGHKWLLDISCICGVGVICIWLLQVGRVSDAYSIKRTRKTMFIYMKDQCGNNITVPDNIDDVRISFLTYHGSYSRIIKCEISIRSRAFDYVYQTYKLDVSAGLGEDISCITLGNHAGDQKRFCNKPSPQNEYVYTSTGDFFVKAEYQLRLRFSLDMDMHAQARDGKPFYSDQSRDFDQRRISYKEVNMKNYCGKTLQISKDPLFMYYHQETYGNADCKIKVINNNRPFIRIALQVIGYEDINGFCLKTTNIGALGGLTFCEDSRPNVNRAYLMHDNWKEGMNANTSWPHNHDISITGSGSAFMRFIVLLYTFHEDDVCHDRVCGNNVCLPEAYKCQPFNPCGDNTNCSDTPTETQRRLAKYLTAFCGIFTAMFLFGEFCCYIRSTKTKKDNDVSQQAQPMTEFEPDALHVQPSAPKQPSTPVKPTVPPLDPYAADAAPDYDFPPSYIEAVSEPMFRYYGEGEPDYNF